LRNGPGDGAGTPDSPFKIPWKIVRASCCVMIMDILYKGASGVGASANDNRTSPPLYIVM
jgi:hypothetical protein